MLDSNQHSGPRCLPPAPRVLEEQLQAAGAFSSHFLILDLPKIALTGDINGLLLASS